VRKPHYSQQQRSSPPAPNGNAVFCFRQPASARTNKSEFIGFYFQSAERHFRYIFQRAGFLISVPSFSPLVGHIKEGGKEKERRSELFLFIYTGTALAAALAAAAAAARHKHTAHILAWGRTALAPERAVPGCSGVRVRGALRGGFRGVPGLFRGSPNPKKTPPAWCCQPFCPPPPPPLPSKPGNMRWCVLCQNELLRLAP
jgi:hypothetical protein